MSGSERLDYDPPSSGAHAVGSADFGGSTGLGASSTGYATSSAGVGSTAFVDEEAEERAREAEDTSLGEIVGRLASDFSSLMRAEIALAKAEAKEEAKAAGKGVGFLAGAGYAGHLLTLFLSLALMFLLDVWLPIGWAALIVALIWGIVAFVLYSNGRKNLQRTAPPMQETVETLKEDAQWAKNPRG